MITVTLASGSYAEAVRHCDHPAEFANGVELRIDTWEAVDPVEVGHCLEQCRRRYTIVILTMRLQRDGGACTAGRRRRNRILLECVRKLPPDVYVDLEIEQLGSGEDDKLCTAIAEAGGRVIRSYHSFEPGVDMDALQQLGRVSGAELPKAAVMPESTGDLLQLLMFARSFRPGDQIVLGMGEWGMPSRMCPLVFGSCWTYAADSSGPAAPGQLTAAELAIRCRTHLHTPATKYFAIFGNPVMHSRSPEFHNQRFEEARYNAVYVPFPLSDADAGIRVMQQWPLVGVSVTIPHKHGVLLWENTDPEEAVQAVGAANTAVGGQFGIRLSNTDVEGFLYPLLERGFTLRSTRCLVIGAGGAARAVVYGLLLHGATVLVLNRTLSRAESLVSELQQVPLHSQAAVSAAELANIDAGGINKLCMDHWGELPQLVVQTTQVGMEPDISGDPLPGYAFSGNELVYDIIYTPEHTAILHRAAASGCPVITGKAMFTAQAEAQSRRFMEALAALD